METAFYLASHGTHFHTAPTQPISSARSDGVVDAEDQTKAVPAAAEGKIERTDQATATSAQNRAVINPQRASIFFTLPAELHNQILQILLCPPDPPLHPLTTPTPLHPAILATCKRIHHESITLLYTRHTFHAHPSLLTALPHLSDPGRPVLRPKALQRISRWRLTLRLDTDPRFSAAQVTAAFSGAEFFELRVWQGAFQGCGVGVLRLFTGVRDVRVCRVRGSVEDGLARWLERRMMLPRVEEEGDEGQCCQCQGERSVRCEGCGKRVWLDGDEAKMWVDEGDVWRLGNR